MMSSERDDLPAAGIKEWIGTYHKGIRALPLRGGKRRIDLAHAAGYDDMQLPAQCPRRLLHIFALVGDFRTLRVNHQYGDADIRYEFAQQLQLLGSQFSIEPADSCYVSARTAQASDETNLNGVGTAREDDRDRCSRSFGR